MEEAMFELERILLSRKITAEELDALKKCKSKTSNGTFTGFFAGHFIMWAATSRLGRVARVLLSGGSAAFSGFLVFKRTLHSSLDSILDQSGSRMQMELANILLRKHEHDPWTFRLMYKHFFMERVFSDLHMDVPLTRWRPKNLFNDNTDSDFIKEITEVPHDGTYDKRTQFPSPLVVHMSNKPEENPLDLIFGIEEEGAPLAGPPGTHAAEQSRQQKRSNRRRRRFREDTKKEQTE